MDVNQRAQLGKEKRLCFSCFYSADHQSRVCPRKARCDVGDCNKCHHPLIHGAAPVFVGSSSVNCVSSTVLLQIVPIAITTPTGVKVDAFALLDSGSQTSLILEDFADTIGLVGENGALHLGTINSPGEPVRPRKVSFYVGAVEGSETGIQIPVEDAWTVSQLNLPPQKVTRTRMQNFPHLNDPQIPEVSSEDVTVLLGANVLEETLQRDVRRGRPGQPAAVLTSFGWTLAGSVKSVVKPECLYVMHVHRALNAEETLNKQVEDWWRTESFDTKYEHETPRSREDLSALESLERTVKHVGDRYEDGMLWKDEDVKFPGNRLMAERRLESTERRLKSDEVLAEKYCAIIDDYVNSGFCPIIRFVIPTSRTKSES